MWVILNLTILQPYFAENLALGVGKTGKTVLLNRDSVIISAFFTMIQFNSCQELIEYLISTYNYPSVGNYLLNDDEVEVYGGMMPRICIHIISPKYPRTLFFLQADEDIYGNIHFAILMNEGVNDELPCVSLPKKYLDELYLTMNNQVVEDSKDLEIE